MPPGMTLSQFTVLNHFVRLARVESPAQLASAFQVTRGAMTNTLTRLEKQGYVTVRPNPDDGRAKLVDITSEGRKAHGKCLELLRPQLKTLEGKLGKKGFTDALPQLQNVREFLDAAR